MFHPTAYRPLLPEVPDPLLVHRQPRGRDHVLVHLPEGVELVRELQNVREVRGADGGSWQVLDVVGAEGLKNRLELGRPS